MVVPSGTSGTPTLVPASNAKVDERGTLTFITEFSNTPMFSDYREVIHGKLPSPAVGDIVQMAGDENGYLMITLIRRKQTYREFIRLASVCNDMQHPTVAELDEALDSLSFDDNIIYREQ